MGLIKPLVTFPYIPGFIISANTEKNIIQIPNLRRAIKGVIVNAIANMCIIKLRFMNYNAIGFHYHDGGIKETIANYSYTAYELRIYDNGMDIPMVIITTGVLMITQNFLSGASIV